MRADSFAAFTPASGHMRKISRAFSNCSLEKISLHEGETSSGKEEVSARALYDTELVFSARAVLSSDAPSSAKSVRKK